MRNAVRLLILTFCLVLGLAASALATPETDFKEALTAARAGEMDKAIAAFNRVIEAGASVEASNLASAFNLRGLCYEAKNNLDQAMADYNKAIEIDAKSAEALGNRAMLYMKLGQTDKAKVDAVAAKRIDRKVKVPTFD